MAKVTSQKPADSSVEKQAMSDSSRALISRLASQHAVKEEIELKSIAEAMGISIEEVTRERERMEIEARLNRIEMAVEKFAASDPHPHRSHVGEVFEFLRNPGAGIEVLLQCIGAAIILLVIGGVIAWGIHINRGSVAAVPTPPSVGQPSPITGATGETGTAGAMPANMEATSSTAGN